MHQWKGNLRETAIDKPIPVKRNLRKLKLEGSTVRHPQQEIQVYSIRYWNSYAQNNRVRQALASHSWAESGTLIFLLKLTWCSPRAPAHQIAPPFAFIDSLDQLK